MGNDTFYGETFETILQQVRKEILLTQKAKMELKPLPRLDVIGLLLVDGLFDKIPQEEKKAFGYSLLHIDKRKKGRPSTKDNDSEIYEDFEELRRAGFKSEFVIEMLSKKRNHTDTRSTRKAVARGRKIVKMQREESHQRFIDECQMYGIMPSGNFLADLPKLMAARTGKKSPE